MEYIGKGMATMAIWWAVGYYGKEWGFFAIFLGIFAMCATCAIWVK